MKLKKLLRWLLVVVVAGIIVSGVAYGTIKYYVGWLQHQPLLIIEDSYGRRTEIRQPYQTIEISGPARAWSPRYDIGIWEDGWRHPKFQITDVSVALKTRGGKYTFYLQPTDWGGIDRDLRHNIGEITIDLN